MAERGITGPIKAHIRELENDPNLDPSSQDATTYITYLLGLPTKGSIKAEGGAMLEALKDLDVLPLAEGESADNVIELNKTGNR
jgi:hypothetical protein